jgi:class 3 adenylate cyclase
VDNPQTKYAKSADGAHIAYQVFGDGPVDIVLVGVGYSNIEFMWQLPPVARFLRRLASFARVIQFDPRGIGVSDPLIVERLPTLEMRMADTLAVMEAVASERATLMGGDSTGALATLFAATYPERTTALILYATTACGLVKPDFPWSWTEEKWETHAHEVEEGWGDPAYVKGYMRWMAPTVVLDDALLQAWTSFFRLAASPGAVAAQDRMERDTDVRGVLATVQVPTLVMHRSGDQFYSVEEGRYLAQHIPGARFIEMEGVDHPAWFGDTEALVAEVERFLSSVRNEEAQFDRVLATVLFTDIVGSTGRAAELGDTAWKALLERHHATVRAMLARYRGTEIDTAGDGFLATFDGPARGVRCAQAITEAMRPLGLEVRAALHTGEVETIDGKVGGIAVHIGARVGTLAGPSEVLVSQTVKDLVAGSGLTFEDRGEHELKGVPDRWHLYRVRE